MLQHLDLGKLAGFGNRDHGLLTIARNFLFKRYASKLAIIGNNMLTGQHAISFSPQANQQEVIAGSFAEIQRHQENKTSLLVPSHLYSVPLFV